MIKICIFSLNDYVILIIKYLITIYYYYMNFYYYLQDIASDIRIHKNIIIIYYILIYFMQSTMIFILVQ